MPGHGDGSQDSGDDRDRDGHAAIKRVVGRVLGMLGMFEMFFGSVSHVNLPEKKASGGRQPPTCPPDSLVVCKVYGRSERGVKE